jgi:hypothetical protein
MSLDFVLMHPAFRYLGQDPKQVTRSSELHEAAAQIKGSTALSYQLERRRPLWRFGFNALELSSS